MGWIWGSSSAAPSEVQDLSGELTDSQRRELYDAIDYDEKAAIAQSFEASSDTQKLRVRAKLNRGSFSLRSDSHSARGSAEVISIVFDSFEANFIERQEGLETEVALGSFSVFDNVSSGSIYRQIVKVKTNTAESQEVDPGSQLTNSFLYIKFEQHPLDDRSDNALIVKMRHMEIIYNTGYVEAIYRFFKPPDSQLESVEALLVSHSAIPMVATRIQPSQLSLGCSDCYSTESS